MPASSIVIEGNKVSLPFSTLDYGNDYYVLMEKGVVYGLNGEQTCYSQAITSPLIWNWHTVSKDDPPIPPAAPANVSRTVAAPSFKPTPVECLSLKYKSFETQSKLKDSNDQKVDVESNIKIVFNNPIAFGTTGKITIKKASGSTHQEFDIAKSFKNGKISELFWIDGNKIVLNPTKDFDPATEYYVLLDPNVVYDSCGINGNERISDTNLIKFKTDKGPTV